ncbi:GntR family transcriptional regulator [Cytobacillus sp. Hz8]|uniref:GntR family transcriptional regulator n=1 Tax=Cytobacillus sp. Hz8 TaxID=3347168 RepID=UPI0035E2C75F
MDKGNNDNNDPLYKQIADDLLNKIDSGVFKEDQLIPKEVELADKYYKVSRPTIRKAIEILVNDGYLERKKRKGTIVKRKRIVQEFTQVLESYDEQMIRKGLEPRTTVLSFNKDKANREIKENLELEEGDEVYKLIRLRYTGEDPNVLVTSYLPVKLLPNLLTIDFTKRRLYQVLSEQGHAVDSVVRTLNIEKADETTGHLLNIEENDPIYYFHTIGYTGNKVPVEFSISKYRSDINTFIFQITSEDKFKLQLKDANGHL